MSLFTDFHIIIEKDGTVRIERYKSHEKTKILGRMMVVAALFPQDVAGCVVCDGDE